MARIDQIVLDLPRSIAFDKEEWLEDLVRSLHTTPEEFARLYVLEEYPLNIAMSDFSDILDFGDKYAFKLTQEFRIRRKTPEEMAEDNSRLITQGEI